MSLFPENDKLRKNLPVWKYWTRYFPKAHREVTKVCVVNNVRYNPDKEPTDIQWNRDKSKDQLGSGVRHLLEHAVDGKVFEEVPPDVAMVTGIDRVYVLAEAMWRIGAELELTIEKAEATAENPAAVSQWLTTCWIPRRDGFGDAVNQCVYCNQPFEAHAGRGLLAAMRNCPNMGA